MLSGRQNAMYHNLLGANIANVAQEGSVWKDSPERWHDFIVFHKLSNEEIFVEGELYLRRHFMEPRIMDKQGKHGSRILLHEFFTGDADLRPHNHPWELAESAILSGGYSELRVIGLTQDQPIILTKEYAAGQTHQLTGMDFHRILQVQPHTFTLFRHSKRVKNWGFLEYTADSDGGMVYRIDNYVNGAARHTARPNAAQE